MSGRLSGWVLLGLALWTAIGLAGLALAGLRGERTRLRRSARTLAAVWVGYMALLLAVSLRQPPAVFAAGQPRCFGSMCFAITAVEAPPGFRVRGQQPERLVRVLIRVQNRDTTHAGQETGLRVHLLDADGRRFDPVPGLGGVRLSTAVPPGGSVLSEPVFRVPADAGGLRMVLKHDGWTAARLRLGDPESYAHRPAVMLLPPGRAG